jgi:uncharacterized protein YjiS (DUF1127 family)
MQKHLFIVRRRPWRDRASHLGEILVAWLERGAGRRALSLLDEHRLRDIGLTREQARAEAAKPCWRR